MNQFVDLLKNPINLGDIVVTSSKYAVIQKPQMVIAFTPKRVRTNDGLFESCQCVVVNDLVDEQTKIKLEKHRKDIITTQKKSPAKWASFVVHDYSAVITCRYSDWGQLKDTLKYLNFPSAMTTREIGSRRVPFSDQYKPQLHTSGMTKPKAQLFGLLNETVFSGGDVEIFIREFQTKCEFNQWIGNKQ